LCITREEIENYLKDHKLTYCTDSTNLSNDYARNRIRNEVIPALGKVNNKAMENIAAFAEGVGEAEEYLLGLTLERYKEYCVEEGNGILFKNPEKEHPYMCSRLVRMIIGNTGVGLKDFTGGHIEEILSMLSSNVGAKKHVRNGLYVERRGEGLLFYIKKEVVRTPVMVNPPMEITPWEDAGKFIFSIEDWNNNKKITNEVYTKQLDYDKIKFGLQLRGWQQGDVIAIDDKGHHKKLKQYFVDERMSRVEKEEALLLADGNNIVWVVGKRIGADYKITENTKRVLEVRYEGGNQWKE
jgi:tRNA(Ile)-lysidine synthase